MSDSREACRPEMLAAVALRRPASQITVMGWRGEVVSSARRARQVGSGLRRARIRFPARSAPAHRARSLRPESGYSSAPKLGNWLTIGRRCATRRDQRLRRGLHTPAGVQVASASCFSPSGDAEGRRAPGTVGQSTRSERPSGLKSTLSAPRDDRGEICAACECR